MNHEIARRETQAAVVRYARAARPLARSDARTGLGADFSSLNQIPEFQSAWGDIQKQIQSEGGSALDLQAAQDTLVKSFTDLTTTQFGLDATQALASAKEFTLAAKTVAGAVDHIQGLVQAARAGAQNPQQIVQTFQMFTGTLIGLAGAAGAFSAGVGALIVTGVGLALNLLESLGLFGSAPQGQEVCPGVWCTNPNWVVGCICAWGPRIAAGAANWRHFPDSSDRFWFGDPAWNGGASSSSALGPSTPFITHNTAGGGWNGVNWGMGVRHRAIDVAFPEYFYLEIEQSLLTPGLEDFQRGLFSAWKANREYALNGLQVQPDWQVLLHYTRVWNRSHEPGQIVSLGYVPRANLSAPQDVYGPIQLPAGLFGGVHLPPYAATLMQDVLNNVSASDPSNYLSNGQLQIFTGALKTPPKLVPIHVGAAAAAGAGLSTGAKVAIATAATAGAIAVGTGLYAWARGESYKSLWSRIWRSSGGRVFRHR